MKKNVFIAIIFSLVFPCSTYAGEVHTVKDDEQWDFTVTPYLWMPAINGKVSVNRLPEKDIDIKFKDILKRLNAAFMGELEARTENFGFTFDYIYMDLSDSTSSDIFHVNNDFSYDIKQTLASASIFYNALQHGDLDFDLYAGLRYNKVEQSLDIKIQDLKKSGQLKEEWVDPVTGIRFSYKLTDNFFTKNTFDIGGFDVGSKISVQFSTSLNYMASDKLKYAIGYRVLKTDYDSEDFNYDVVYDGVFLNASYTF